MEIEIIAIGSEVLTGSTINTNAAFISMELEKAGFKVGRHTVLPDNALHLKEGLAEALQRSHVVIATGGLGPTCDDITRKTAAELFDSDFVLNNELWEELKQRYGSTTPTLEDQATVPRKALIMPNKSGTAPGFIFESNIFTLLLMPGVPYEMKEMWNREAMPFLSQKFSSLSKRHVKNLNFFNLREADVDPFLRELQKWHPEVEFGIYTSLGTLTLHLEANGENHLNAPYQALVKRFSKNIYSSPSGKIEEAVQLLFLEKKWTLSIAESCTGGSVASRLTRLPGASNYFLGSMVVYSNTLKTKVLGVPAELIERCGAVSEEVVTAMIKGILDLTKSDFALAVTGIAGPGGGSESKPAGTVWIGVGSRDGSVQTRHFTGRGNREMIIERSVNSLLAELLLFCGANAQ